MRDHYNLLFTSGMADAVQEAQRRAGSMTQSKSKTTNCSISELSHRESLIVLDEVFKETIETKDRSADYFFSAGYCQAHGLSVAEAVFLKVIIDNSSPLYEVVDGVLLFLQPSLISIVVRNTASHLQKRYEQELSKAAALSNNGWVELLQATYGVASLIVSAVKRCEQDESFSTDVGTLKQVDSLPS